MQLREFLFKVAGSLPDEYNLNENWDENDLCEQHVKIKFEYKGEQSDICCPVDHPILMPLYQAEISSISAEWEDQFVVWIKTDDMEGLLKGEKK